MPKLHTIQDRLYWCYANLCMAHAALSAERSNYGPGMYAIRSSMWRRLNDGEASPRSLVFDEKEKMRHIPTCAYCGADGELAADHLIPTSVGGPDSGANLVRACRPCNSSKSNGDLWIWYERRNEFPPLLVVRRYFKCAYVWLQDKRLMTLPLSECADRDLPFDIDAWPTSFPAPSELRLRVH